MELELIDYPASISQRKTQQKKSLAPLDTWGYLMLAASFLTYAVCECVGVKQNLFMIFFLHHFISVAYTIILLSNGVYGIRKSWRRENIDLTIIALNLYLISAYALNREMQVFSTAVDWFCIYILISSCSLLSFRYFKRLPSWINKLQLLTLGSAALLYLYLGIYVADFYGLGSVGIIAIGIGSHVFVPIALFTACIFICTLHSGKQTYYWVGAGIAIPVCAAILFTSEWSSRASEIETFANKSTLYKSELPVWINVAQRLKNDWISERLLKSNLVFTTASRKLRNWEFMPSSASWDDIKKHDPLVFIASLRTELSLSAEDRTKILKTISNKRHKANERLWSGDDLATSYIVSDIDIYADLRLAYTEKYINVRNNNERAWWGNTQEAIYTFYLPEGSVVTSLSLWIGGKESKGILTSKQKATNAYKTIVGVEQRDPSVVHWQEGNMVTVRVFPCTREEERKFKIGITSPLKVEKGRTTYQNVIFDGPNAEHAKEVNRVRIIGPANDLHLQDEFVKDENGDYIREGKYDPDFSLNFKTTPIRPTQFTFDGYVYSSRDYQQRYRPFTSKNIYLDINSTWDKGELQALMPLLTQHNLYVFSGDDFIKLDSSNWQERTAKLRDWNFSLFPFHRIKDPEHALIITKGAIPSPHLSDFGESNFGESISKFFSKEKRTNVFNLSGGTSTYISTFKEFRGFEYASGSVSDLLKMLTAQQFVSTDEGDDKVILHDANMAISKVECGELESKTNGSDHLARLFAYNDIMRKVGSKYLDHDYISEPLIDEASKAYVVSPVSSLIVLESQQDYERFGIEDAVNSLHNATKQSSGAVPEPHEWALIILFVAFILYLRFKQS